MAKLICTESCEDVVLRSALLVERVAERTRKLLTAGESDAGNGIMLVRSNAYIGKCIRAVRLLVHEDHVAQAIIICRTAYECAVRLLWASIARDGWQRLQAYWADEDIKWTKQAAEFSQLAGHASSVREEREKVLSRSTPSGSNVHKAPALSEMLKDIERADIAAGRVSASQRQHVYQYANFYRIASGFAHGHPGMVAAEVSEKDLPYVAVFAAYAAKAMRLANDAALSDRADFERTELDAEVRAIWNSLEAMCGPRE